MTTGFTTNKEDPKYNYELRRQSLRSSWVPATDEARKELLEGSGIVVEFVIGHSPLPEAEEAVAREQAAHGGFLRLDLVETYADLPRKTLVFFSTVLQKYRPRYIFKVDDDVFLRLDRVAVAVAQWASIEADYVGCMKGGQVLKSPRYRWYEPNHALLGPEYFTHTWGSAYVLSREIVEALLFVPPRHLRRLANEDVTVGAWMLALNATHYDDRRMCAAACSDSSLVVYDYPKCAGLCEPVKRLLELQADPACHSPALQPSGALPLVKPIFIFDAQPDPKWDAKAKNAMRLQRRRTAARIERARHQAARAAKAAVPVKAGD
ncbi:hypothetical protein QBZ16_004306 [Prototheca wickerhamii]|uniref:Hexosyltransferase n=1 Tax=Prototheca wickerhamii TaxID=3111 RepID=A0AAD9MMS0_PROWI|nr:hypothetical protein QBZ16_004306 [Prototheca wickerhamii]